MNSRMSCSHQNNFWILWIKVVVYAGGEVERSVSEAKGGDKVTEECSSVSGCDEQPNQPNAGAESG